MKILDLIQGTPEWHATRAKFNTASEAPAMMGASSKVKRNELLHMKATGSEREFSDWVQVNLLDRGHEIEALVRPLVEEIIGEELYPVTATDDQGELLASYDGMTMGSDVGFECKMWNEALAECVRAKSLAPEYYWQLEQQLLVGKDGGLDRIIFACSDGTPERFEWMEYRAVPGRAEQLQAGWKQFNIDRAGYVPVEVVPAAVPAPIAALPALLVQIEGRVVTSNLVAFRETASKFIQGINTDLQTDQHFADAELTVKFCKDGEDRLELVKAQALAQTASIDELFRTIDSISAELRTKRLELDRLVKSRKENIRIEIRQGGIDGLAQHIAALNTRLGKPYMPVIESDFAGVMKSKRTIASLRDAVDTELARAKIEANQVADRIQLNLNTLRELAGNYTFLFADTATIVLKNADDLTMLVKSRIADHEAAEAARIEADRERIRKEEQAKAEKAAAEQLAREQQNAEAQRQLDARLAAAQHREDERQADLAGAALASRAPANEVTHVVASEFHEPARMPQLRAAPTTPPTLRLGQIESRLGFALTAEFLRTLGFEPASRDRNAVLYHETTWPSICAKLVDHITKVATAKAA